MSMRAPAVFTWRPLPLWRKTAFVAGTVFVIGFYANAWPTLGSSYATTRTHLALISQLIWMSALLLTCLAPGHDRSFRTWPTVCKWLFAIGLAGQLVALAWLTLGW